LLKVERASPEDVPALLPLGVEPEADWTLVMEPPLELLLLVLSPLLPLLLEPPPAPEPPLLPEFLLGVAVDSLDVVVVVVWWVEDEDTCVVLDADAERDEVGALQEALRLRGFSGV